MTVWALWFNWQSDCGMQKNLVGLFSNKESAESKVAELAQVLTIRSRMIKDYHSIERIEVK